MNIPVSSHIRGLIFDCDGTLVDSMPAHLKTWRLMLDKYELQCSDAFLDSRKGSPISEIVREISKMNNKPIHYEQFAWEKEEAFRSIAQTILPIGPVLDVVKKYHKTLPMAVASGSPYLSVMHSLKSLNLDSYFDVILTPDDGLRPKPAPDLFLEAAARIGIPPEQCQVFEDGDLGLEAAKQAGMYATDIRLYLEE